MPVPEGVFAAPDRFAYTDFLDFLRTYDLAASVIRTGDDYRDVTYEYLAGCAREGALYVELTASPDHAALVGLSDEEHLDGIARGIDDARRDFGIEGRILISCVRNFGIERALRVARYAAARPHEYVVGFSMAGDEENFPAGDYVEAFEIAAGAGLGCTVHAGEWAGADSVRAGMGCPSRGSATACARSRTRSSYGRSRSAASCSSAAPPATSCWAPSTATRTTRCRACAQPA